MILGSHIDNAGSIFPLSAKSSPAIKKAQYIKKNIRLIAILIENLPLSSDVKNLVLQKNLRYTEKRRRI